MAVGTGFGQVFKGIGKDFFFLKKVYPGLIYFIRSSWWSRYFISHFPVKPRKRTAK
jgi:hypothetical protein